MPRRRLARLQALPEGRRAVAGAESTVQASPSRSLALAGNNAARLPRSRPARPTREHPPPGPTAPPAQPAVRAGGGFLLPEGCQTPEGKRWERRLCSARRSAPPGS